MTGRIVACQTITCCRWVKACARRVIPVPLIRVRVAVARAVPACHLQLDAADLRHGAAEGLDAILSGAQSSLVMPYASSKVCGPGGGASLLAVWCGVAEAAGGGFISSITAAPLLSSVQGSKLRSVLLNQLDAAAVSYKVRRAVAVW